VSPYHPKIAPFPYGLKEGGITKLNPLPSYKHKFFGSIQNKNKSLLNKSNFIFAGPFGKWDGKRSSLPQLTTRMNTTDFFLEMAKSKYSCLLMATDQNAFVIMKRLDLDLCP